MNKINLHKIVNKDVIEQSFYEEDDEPILLRNKTELSIQRSISRVNTTKSIISLDVDNINKYFMTEYYPEGKLGQIPEVRESFNEVEIDLSKGFSKGSRQVTCENLYYLRNKGGHKSILEEFITIGIETKGLEYTDLDELCLTPKILANYPNNLEESELRLYIKI
jgi:hypothetical protein